MKFMLATPAAGGGTRWLNVGYIKTVGWQLVSAAEYRLIVQGDFGTEGSDFVLPGTYATAPEAQAALERLLQGVDPSIFAS